MGKLTKAQARAAIRDHWAEFIANADYPDCLPDDPNIWAVMEDETKRIVRLILGRKLRAALSKEP